MREILLHTTLTFTARNSSTLDWHWPESLRERNGQVNESQDSAERNNSRPLRALTSSLVRTPVALMVVITAVTFNLRYLLLNCE
jgi:hypothetical protein